MRMRLSAVGGIVLLALALDGCAPTGPTTTAFDGVYQGQGTLSNPGLPCQTTAPLNPMKVSGGHVDFGNLHGWVQQNGQLTLEFGQVYVVGQFQGTQFTGQIEFPQPACNYNINMNKVS